jgi:glycosyltransferase involved in cell wall biosynthesis
MDERNRNKLISVVIPVYNGGKYLAAAIESVLAQTYRPIETVVVDDGSTDDTAKIAQTFREIIYVFQENQGNAVARNTGLAHCTGDLISLLDADDYWPVSKCETQVAYLERHPGLGCVIGKMRNFLDEGVVKPEWIPESMMADDGVALSLGAMLAHRWVFDRIGNFNTLYWHGNDFDWFIRLKEAGIAMGVMPDIFLHRRIHTNNESRKQNVLARERIRVLKASMDRMRGIQNAPMPGIR